MAFFAHVLGLLALGIDLVIQVADVVDDAGGALIGSVNLIDSILRLSGSSLVHCSCQAPSQEFVLLELDRQLLDLIFHFEDLALLLRILLRVALLPTLKLFHALF